MEAVTVSQTLRVFGNGVSRSPTWGERFKDRIGDLRERPRIARRLGVRQVRLRSARVGQRDRIEMRIGVERIEDGSDIGCSIGDIDALGAASAAAGSETYSATVRSRIGGPIRRLVKSVVAAVRSAASPLASLMAAPFRLTRAI